MDQNPENDLGKRLFETFVAEMPDTVRRRWDSAPQEVRDAAERLLAQLGSRAERDPTELMTQAGILAARLTVNPMASVYSDLMFNAVQVISIAAQAGAIHRILDSIQDMMKKENFIKQTEQKQLELSRTILANVTKSLLDAYDEAFESGRTFGLIINNLQEGITPEMIEQNNSFRRTWVNADKTEEKLS